MILKLLVAVFWGLGVSALSYAQGVTQAQEDESRQLQNEEILRQQQREQQRKELEETIPNVHLPGGEVKSQSFAIPENESPCFIINELEIVGEEAEQFQWARWGVLLNPRINSPGILGKCLGAQGINSALKQVQNAIIKEGFITTRVLASPQNLKTGKLQLSVIPGKIRSIVFKEGADFRAQQFNALPMSSGDLLNLRDIEQGLENFKRLPTVEADIKIKPAEGDGAKPGESDLDIEWAQANPFRFSLSLDDSGAKSTGKLLGSATVSHDHWFTLNDLFYFNYVQNVGGEDKGKRGNSSYTMHYSLPFGYWLLGVNISKSRYFQTVAGAFQNYTYKGVSRKKEIKLSRVFYRDAVRKSTLSVSAYLKKSRNHIDDTEVLVQRRRTAGWQANISHKEFFGKSVFEGNLNYQHGTGMWNALAPPEEEFSEGSWPVVISSDARLTIPLLISSQRFRYGGYWHRQWNKRALLIQDQFSIGGRHTVRGFDGRQSLLAERGWLMRNTLSAAIEQTGFEIYAGLDHGRVSGPSAEFLLGNKLTGGVLGVRGQYKGLSLDYFVGRPLSRPEGFVTDSTTTGFNLNLSF